MKLNYLTLATVLLLLGCAEPVSAPQQATESAADPNEVANAFFERAYDERLNESPMTQSFLGIRDRYDEWDDFSPAQRDRTLALYRRQRDELLDLVDPAELDHQARLSFDMFLKGIERYEAADEFRYHNYPVNQMGGIQSRLTAFMINIHRVGNVDDAEAYISRLERWGTAFDQSIDGLLRRADMGILAPRFVYKFVRDDCNNVLKGRPFDANADFDSTLLADFKVKVAGLDLPEDESAVLIGRAVAALTESVGPAFNRLLATVDELERRSTDDDGVWKFPDGERFYNLALRQTTTTDKTADEIHAIGVAEVERIHDEMRAIMQAVEFEGSLQDFFEFMRTDSQFYYENTAAGRQRYLDEATALIESMQLDLPTVFSLFPKASLDVKAVEPFREKSAGKAFYQRPAPDGSRPGTYYANLYRMEDMPTYQMEALAYHEGIPGHHMQIAIAQELQGLPRFRRFGGFTAYIEGWGLYSEWLPKEMGRYQDPYSDFGRLAMELWRACRLVVDTGIHAKRWTRQQAIDYLITNTPNPAGDAEKAIERYIVLPSQATAYMIGMIEIIELRRYAEAELGEAFDLRAFHDTILGSGPLPLDILRGEVEKYVANVRG